MMEGDILWTYNFYELLIIVMIETVIHPVNLGP